MSYISKQTAQDRKNYLARAFKNATSRSSNYVYAARAGDGYLVSDSYLLLRLPCDMAYKLDWLRGVTEPVKLKSDQPNAAYSTDMAATLSEWDSKADIPLELTRDVRDFDSMDARILTMPDGETIYVDRDKLRLMGESFSDLGTFTFHLYRETKERTSHFTKEGRWTPEEVTEIITRDTILVRDKSGVAQMALMSLMRS